MRIQRDEHGTQIWLSARDTRDWATKPGASWPGSFLQGRRVFAEFDRHGDLVDISIDGGRGDQDCPADEFSAIIEDRVGSAHPVPAVGAIVCGN